MVSPPDWTRSCLAAAARVQPSAHPPHRHMLLAIATPMRPEVSCTILPPCPWVARTSSVLYNSQCIDGFSAKLDGRRSVWRQVCQTCAQSGPSTAFHTSGIRARPGPGCRSLPMEESAGSPRQLRRRRLPARPRGRCGGTWRVGRLQALGTPDGTPRRWRRGLRCPFRERDRRARSGAYTRSVASGRRVRYRRRGDARGPRSNR